MSSSSSDALGAATCRRTDVGVRVRGTVDRRNAPRIAGELLATLGTRRTGGVVDLSDVVFADCAGVRIVRGALSSLDGSGVPLEILTSDPVARVSFDLRRVA
jgi:anti-anti-sigma factor